MFQCRVLSVCYMRFIIESFRIVTYELYGELYAYQATRPILTGVRRPERETDRPPKFIVDVRVHEYFHPLLLCVFTAQGQETVTLWCSVFLEKLSVRLRNSLRLRNQKF